MQIDQLKKNPLKKAQNTPVPDLHSAVPATVREAYLTAFPPF